ncbi:hypothetical protein ACIQTU_13760 [Brevundimonas sp. NPDC090276]|uniref:hypothetical protein n=1 Tax=Brevundimonas sp. NPDC090276 TaxID=3363956 RepID=UPI00383B42CF
MKTALVLATSLAVALPALAQDPAGDWDVNRDAEKNLTIAYTVFDNGLGVGARCSGGNYQVLISGLPTTTGTSRPLRIAFRDGEFGDQRWSVGDDATVAISEYPGSLARSLRKGGRMQIVVPSGGEVGKIIRYVIDLPSSGAAIDETLTACGRPLVDPRDAELAALDDKGLPANLRWAREPLITYPEQQTYRRGFAILTCLTRPDGYLRDCAVETENPPGGGFGPAALNGTRRARVVNQEGGPVPLQFIAFRANFNIDGEPASPRRLR